MLPRIVVLSSRNMLKALEVFSREIGMRGRPDHSDVARCCYFRATVQQFLKQPTVFYLTNEYTCAQTAELPSRTFFKYQRIMIAY